MLRQFRLIEKLALVVHQFFVGHVEAGEPFFRSKTGMVNRCQPVHRDQMMLNVSAWQDALRILHKVDIGFPPQTEEQ